jgi:hypothetical protein
VRGSRARHDTYERERPARACKQEVP